ncbi:MAG: hypothetical protein HKO01_03560 [Flaviramulus sp.]|nr:hypothetical protein [Flaviramulus sp.]NNC49593.1 hypothetical protein [Flaviramulus sp.]
MTLKTCICLLYVMVSPLFIVGQDIQIEISNEDNYTVFMTSMHRAYLNTIESQSENIKRELKNLHTRANYRVGSGFSNTFFKMVLSEKKEDIFKAERQINLKIVYNINETGNTVFSCALYFPKEHVYLSGSEIQAVLVEAMNHKFDFINKPKNESTFYYTVNSSLYNEI